MLIKLILFYTYVKPCQKKTVVNENVSDKTFATGPGLTKSSVDGETIYRYNVTKDLEAFGLHDVFKGYVTITSCITNPLPFVATSC